MKIGFNRQWCSEYATVDLCVRLTTATSSKLSIDHNETTHVARLYVHSQKATCWAVYCTAKFTYLHTMFHNHSQVSAWPSIRHSLQHVSCLSFHTSNSPSLPPSLQHSQLSCAASTPFEQTQNRRDQHKQRHSKTHTNSEFVLLIHRCYILSCHLCRQRPSYCLWLVRVVTWCQGVAELQIASHLHAHTETN